MGTQADLHNRPDAAEWRPQNVRTLRVGVQLVGDQLGPSVLRTDDRIAVVPREGGCWAASLGPAFLSLLFLSFRSFSKTAGVNGKAQAMVGCRVSG